MIVTIVQVLLRAEKRRLERATFGSYDPRRSRALDRVVAAIEALG